MPAATIVSRNGHVCNNETLKYGRDAHHSSVLVCSCGNHAVEFTQPALFPGGRASVQVHCVNPSCEWFMLTRERGAWIEMTGGEAA